MAKIISATQARVRFGEVMRDAQRDPVIVERDGVPLVVVLSKKTFDNLTQANSRPRWRELVATAHALIREDLGSQRLPPPEDVLHNIREEHDGKMSGLR